MANTSMLYERSGVLFSVIGSEKLNGTQLRYSVDREKDPWQLRVEVLCDMDGQNKRPKFVEKEAWDCMMWDLVGSTNLQTYIRYIKPEAAVISDSVSLPTIIFNAPPKEPSRIFYVSTGGVSLTTGPVSTRSPRGVYIIAMDDDDNPECINEELKRKLLEEYARRTLYESLDGKQELPLDEQDLDREQGLQNQLFSVLSSVEDLQTEGPLYLSTALAIVHYIIVSFDAWRGVNQFGVCRNELRLRKIDIRTDGNSVLIKEEGDVLFIFMPLDCADNSLIDVLIAGLHGYFKYLNTKVRSDFTQTLLQNQFTTVLNPAEERVRLTDDLQNSVWRLITNRIYRDYYPAPRLLTVGYNTADVVRIPLYRYVDTRHDIPVVPKFGRSTYNEIFHNVYEKMASLRTARRGIDRRTCIQWSSAAKEVADQNPTNYVGVYQLDSIKKFRLSCACPPPSPATATTQPKVAAGATSTCDLSPPPLVVEGQSADSRVLAYQTLSEEGKKASNDYRVLDYERLLFSLFDNDENQLDSSSVQKAATFLKDYGFVVIRGDFLDETALDEVTRSISDKLIKLYTGDSVLRSSSTTDSKLSSYIDASSLAAFPIIKGQCRLDINPLVHDEAVWTNIRGNEKLFQSYRSIVEHTPGSSSWAGQPVRVRPLAPVTSFRKSGTPRRIRITWDLKPNKQTLYHGMIAVNSMEFPEEGGLVVAPGFHTLAASALSRIEADDASKRYYYDRAHPHSFPFKTNGEKLPGPISDILQGQRGLLCAMSFVPLRRGDVVLWHGNLPYSWLRSQESSKFSLGQLYTLTSKRKSSDSIEKLIEAGALSYKIRERQKAELVRQENAKPRNPAEWVWFRSKKEAAQSLLLNAEFGWNWAAAIDHSSSDAYNTGWSYDEKAGNWTKVQRGAPYRIPPTYNYKTFFRPATDTALSKRIREFTFGTTRFSSHSKEIEPISFRFPESTAETPQLPPANGIDELSRLRSSALALVDDVRVAMEEVIVDREDLEIVTNGIEEIIQEINRAENEEDILSQLEELQKVITIQQTLGESVSDEMQRVSSDLIQDISVFISSVSMDESDTYSVILRELPAVIDSLTDVTGAEDVVTSLEEILSGVNRGKASDLIAEALGDTAKEITQLIMLGFTDSKLEGAERKILELKNMLDEGEPQSESQQTLFRKRGREEEEEEPRQLSLSERLMQEGVTADTLKAIYAPMNANMYGMRHINGSGSRLVGTIEDGSVYLDGSGDYVNITVRLSVNELRPRIGDSLELQFAGSTVSTIRLDRLPFGSGQREVDISSSKRGDVLEASWKLNFERIADVIIELGVQQTLKRQKRAEVIPLGQPVELSLAHQALRDIAERLKSTLSTSFFTLQKSSHTALYAAVMSLLDDYPNFNSQAATDIAIAQQQLEADVKQVVGSAAPDINQRIALARVAAVDYLLNLIMAQKERDSQATILNILGKLITSLSGIERSKEGAAALSSVVAAYTQIANKKKMKFSRLERAERLLKKLKRNEAAAVIAKIIKNYPRSITRKRKQPPPESIAATVPSVMDTDEDEDEDDQLLQFLLEHGPFKIPDRESQLTETSRDSFMRAVKKSATSFSAAANMVNSRTASRNIRELAESVSRLQPTASSINDLMDNQWHIFVTSLRPRERLSYSKSVQQEIKTTVVSDLVREATRNLKTALLLLQPITVEEEEEEEEEDEQPATLPAAQEFEFEENLIQQMAEEEELARRQQEKMAEGLRGRSSRPRMRTPTDIEEFELS